MTYTVLHGDCLDLMPMLGENSVDSIVTDPPYGLSFMGKDWDHGVPGVHFWQEALKVLKPGGYLLAFGGSRTYHRLACAIEDAGFEIRDTIMWVYGSGFPKSLDVSKAIDKAAGAEREVIGVKPGHEEFAGRTTKGHLDFKDGTDGFDRPWMHDDAKREAYHQLTAPATDAARQWEGWGTALKPAHEPIILARKPLEGTVAANVLKHGVGGLNIDGCRVAIDPAVDDPRLGGKGDWSSDKMAKNVYEGGYAGERVGSSPLGRWPANLIHDGSDEVLALFPDSKGQLAKASTSDSQRAGQNAYSSMARGSNGQEPRNDAGSAARFFYCPKASKSDRDEGLDEAPDRILAMSNQAKAEQARGNLAQGESGMNTGELWKNHHPTVKPTELMRYLCRLITPPGGVILDPFTGSGSTGKAAVLEGFGFIGCELQAEYIAIAQARIEAATK